MNTKSALVIGAGVGGMKAALELAETGIKVYLLDRSPNIGGEISQLERQFPTNRCCMCQMLPTYGRDSSSQYCLRKDLYHPYITLISQAEVEKVEGKARDFKVNVRIKSRFIKEDRCIGCDICSEVCPVEVKDEFNLLASRKAVYIKYPQAIPNIYTIDQEHCNRCGACVEKCPTQAIDLSKQDEVRELEVGAVILAAGFDEFDPTEWSEYGYGRHPNVVTSIELERIFSDIGPYEGKLVRPSDKAPVKKVAFLQCIGSRTHENNYCSSACCMYAMKEAMILKEIDPEIEISLFYMDLRAFGKGYHRYYLKARDELGIKFICCRVPTVKQDPQTGNLSLTFLDKEGNLQKEEHDMVVLSIGQRPPKGHEHILGLLGFEKNEWGFCQTGRFSPVETSREGVYVCGPISGPRDIPDTICQATAAASKVATLLQPASEKKVESQVEAPPDEGADLLDEDPGIAIFICRCGGEISEIVDFELLTQPLRQLPQVVGVEEVPYLCLDDTLSQVAERIKVLKANRIIFASCVPYGYERRYQQAVEEAGLNSSLMEVVNLREQVSWVHREEKEAAQKKALALVTVAVEKLRKQEPFFSKTVSIHPQVVVVGGGLAGLISSLSLSRLGVEVHLVEQADVLGGNLKEIQYNLEGDNPQVLLKQLLEEVKDSSLVHLHLETEVVGLSGQMGDFKTVIKDKGENEDTISHGALIVATGGRERKLKEYHYGENDRIVTQKELEEMIVEGKEIPDSVVMIQCVESRDSERPYCSRVCCSQAIANALQIKEKSPQTDVTILYRDIMTYGFKEEYYARCREAGVKFMRYSLEEKPRVFLEDGTIKVEVNTPDLKKTLRFNPGLLVLSAGIDPNENESLAKVLNLELDEDGFFKEAEVKFRPVDFLVEGIFLCGLAHSPMFIEETIAQAQAAAQRVWTLLSKSEVKASRLVSFVNERRCSLCELCIAACPYQARVKDEENKKIIVREALCQGCGACTMVCPNHAAKMKGYREDQMFSMVDSILSVG
ncbi:MAG: CoB--CoM heterodisulfide reductase iron-sulfur subunit A family protein [Deltaproteobacteria bacterium]|nr:CoB--CoM heterodisulfide reductase iron-sulfur subunit A family protein [Deltaproteobacteria bacterium]